MAADRGDVLRQAIPACVIGALAGAALTAHRGGRIVAAGALAGAAALAAAMGVRLPVPGAALPHAPQAR